MILNKWGSILSQGGGSVNYWTFVTLNVSNSSPRKALYVCLAVIKCANTIPFAWLMHALNNSDYKSWLIGLVGRCSTRFAIFDANWAVWLLRCEVVWLCAESSTVSYRPKCLFVYLCSESTERIYHRKFFCGKNTAFVVIKYFYSRWVEFLCRSRNEYDSRRPGEGDGRRGEMGEGRRCANTYFFNLHKSIRNLAHYNTFVRREEGGEGRRSGGENR